MAGFLSARRISNSSSSLRILPMAACPDAQLQSGIRCSRCEFDAFLMTKTHADVVPRYHKESSGLSDAIP